MNLLAGGYREAKIMLIFPVSFQSLALRLPPRVLGPRPRYLVATPLLGTATPAVICVHKLSSLSMVGGVELKKKTLSIFAGNVPGYVWGFQTIRVGIQKSVSSLMVTGG